jgi:hypothetical protein
VTDEAFIKAVTVVLIPIICGVIYQAGRLSQRVDYLQRNIDAIPDAMTRGFEKIAQLIQNGAG